MGLSLHDTHTWSAVPLLPTRGRWHTKPKWEPNELLVHKADCMLKYTTYNYSYIQYSLTSNELCNYIGPQVVIRSFIVYRGFPLAVIPEIFGDTEIQLSVLLRGPLGREPGMAGQVPEGGI